MKPDSAEQDQGALLQTFLTTVQPFFGSGTHLLAGVSDPRRPELITYPRPALLFAGLLLFVCRLGARRQIQHLLRGKASSAAKFEALFQVATCPHGDTVEAAFSRLSPAELQAVVTGMPETLIRRKVLSATRLLDHYYLIAIDGTGGLVFAERHCTPCLPRTQHGVTPYYHPLLEAKFVTTTGLAFSGMTEFIENPTEYPTKQDGELKAFYRLAERLKQRFPRLPICLLVDGLFAGGPTFTRCDQSGGKYLITLQDGDLPSVPHDFEALMTLAPDNHLNFTPSGYPPTPQAYRWMNDMTSVETAHQTHCFAVMECLETSPVQGHAQTRRFQWVSNFHVTAHQVTILANQGGRLRGKIENEGFNVQNHGGYALEHAYTQNATAAKVFYFLVPIAHLLSQLMLHGSLFRQAFPQGVGSAKNLALRVLEAWRNLRLTTTECLAVFREPSQIRFDSA